MSQRLRGKTRLSLNDRRILNRLQEDIPFEGRPWRSIAGELRMKEGNLLKKITFFKKTGIIRRISAIFSPRKINFVSTLVGVKAAPGNIGRIAEKINSYPEVTHNYRRDGEYNIWFTLVAENKARILHIMRRLKKNKKPDDQAHHGQKKNKAI